MWLLKIFLDGFVSEAVKVSVVAARFSPSSFLKYLFPTVLVKISLSALQLYEVITWKYPSSFIVLPTYVEPLLATSPSLVRGLR